MTTELNWDWETIATVLLWKHARKGVVITRQDLGGLPFDRVLIEHRDKEGTHIKLSFVPVEEAQGLRNAAAAVARGAKASISEMQGRWQKLAIVALWKLKRTIPVLLTQSDKNAVPEGYLLLIEGFKQDVLLHFVNRHQARKMLENEDILEKLQ